MPERGTSVNGGNRPPRGNGEGVAQASSLPNTSNIAEHAVFGFMFLAQLRKCVEFYETRISPYQCQIMPCRHEAKLR
uniref:Uncharacterized protein n=1 Tax=Candidatus Kentrum sp. LPFa TaxID=2126335 RepID=A0A450X713_9GAMM|nr:MAG: hypothetical protein BECKLPF1236B_GA0070989_14552 [Candidatus Kentron sp. LPFa]